MKENPFWDDLSPVQRLKATPPLRYFGKSSIEYYLFPKQDNEEPPAPKKILMSLYLSCCNGSIADPFEGINQVYLDSMTANVLASKGYSEEYIRELLDEKAPEVTLVCERDLASLPIVNFHVTYIWPPLKKIQKKLLGIDDPSPSPTAMKLACFSRPWRVNWFPYMNARYALEVCLKYGFTAFVAPYTGDTPKEEGLHIYKIVRSN